MTEKRFVEIDDGLDFSIKDIESEEVFYDCESVVDILNEFYKKNKELKYKYDEQSNEKMGLEEDIDRLLKENKELKERNNRQCKQLDDLFKLIEEKDWRALTDILDDFKRNDEQLQKEWSEYND